MRHRNFLADERLGDALLAPVFFVTLLATSAQLLIKLFCLGKFVAKEAVDLMILDTKMDPNASLARDGKVLSISTKKFRAAGDESRKIRASEDQGRRAHH